MPQTSFRTTEEQQRIIDNAKILLEVVNGKPFNRKEAILEICRRFLINNYKGKNKKGDFVPVVDALNLDYLKE